MHLSLSGQYKTMIFFVCLLCLLLFLLLTPLSLRFRLDTTPCGGWGRLRFFWGPIPLYAAPVEVSLLEFPYLTVRWGNRLFSLPELLKPRPDAFMPPIHFEKIEGTVYTGLAEAGAGTVLLTGGIWVLIKTAGQAFFKEAAFRPVACFGMNVGRIQLEGILSLHPGETLLVYLKEKRSEHADC